MQPQRKVETYSKYLLVGPGRLDVINPSLQKQIILEMVPRVTREGVVHVCLYLIQAHVYRFQYINGDCNRIALTRRSRELTAPRQLRQTPL